MTWLNLTTDQLVAKLRESAETDGGPERYSHPRLMLDAADEIERLCAEIERLRVELNTGYDTARLRLIRRSEITE